VETEAFVPARARTRAITRDGRLDDSLWLGKTSVTITVSHGEIMESVIHTEDNAM